jgi:hypothetical protein
MALRQNAGLIAERFLQNGGPTAKRATPATRKCGTLSFSRSKTGHISKEVWPVLRRAAGQGGWRAIKAIDFRGLAGFRPE